jgi:uncharacterized membrane protein YfcA
MEEFVTFVPLALILCLGIFVQAAAGFGGGLLIVPTLLWLGFTIPAAQCSLLVATIPQNIWGVWTLRDSIPIERVILPGITRIVFLPLGVGVLWTMESLPVDTIRQIVGGVVLLATISIMVIRPKPRESISPIWGMIAFPLSGFFQGLVGMGGPPIVFWIQAHDWDGRQMRGFLFAMFLISIGPAIALLYVVFGDRIVGPGLIAVATFPFLLVATHFGMRFGDWLGRDRLRRVTLWLLILMGLSGLVAPLLSP